MEEKKQAFVLFGYRFFYVFLLSMLCYLVLREQMLFREMAPLHLFVLAVLAAGVSAADSLKGRNYFYGLVVFLAVYALIIWSGKDIFGDGETSPGRAFFTEVFYLMAIVMGIYLCHLLAERFVWIKRLTAFLLLAGLVAVMVSGRQISHFSVALALLYAAAVLTEYIESGWKKQKQGSGAAYLLWLLPFLTGYFVLTAVMPYKDTPYDWALFVNLYRRVQEKVITVTENWIHFGNEDFGISTTGFSEESGFFGDHDKKAKVAMVIDNPNHYRATVYLTGKCYDSFDGRQWEQNVTGGATDCYLDTLMTLCAVYGYDEKYSVDYLREGSIGLRYRYFHTGYLMAPLKTREVKAPDIKAEIRQQGGSFLFSKKQGYGASYRLSYDQLNLGNPVFQKLILAEGELPRQEIFDRAAQKLPEIERTVTLQELADYQERMHGEYMGTAALSPGTERFLQEAVAGADTDYEKLLCLERALGSLSYNERPGRLPKDVDTEEKFMDYFLLDSREGYCSYFASAFVMLARAEGIPARYVQGYVVPLAGRESVEVTANMAHAWPEAWIDGIGWIPFEPTPGFAGRSRMSWETLRKEENAEEAHGNVEETGKEEWEAQNNVLDETAEELTEEEIAELLREEERARKLELLRFMGYFLLMILGLVLLLLLADALWERRRAAKRNMEERFRIEALRDLQILSALGYRRQDAETLSELNRRIGFPIGDFFALCEEVLYGGRVPDEDAVKQLRRVRERLLDRLKREKGKAYALSLFGLYLMRAR